MSSLAEQLKASEKLASDLRAKSIPLWVSRVNMESGEFSALLEAAPSQGVAVVANVQKDSGTIAVVVHAELVKRKVHAGDIVKRLAEIAGGKGGGKPSLAQAGTKTPERIGDALREAERVVYLFA